MKAIQLTRGKVALVDDIDFEWLNQWKWLAHRSVSGTWYAVRDVWLAPSNKRVFMHRLIVDAPTDALVDHVDRNGLNNSRANLRLATESQNHANSLKRGNNTSGFKGVYWESRRKKWMAKIVIARRQIQLGLFDAPGDAARAYDIAAVKFHGKFAMPNFPTTPTTIGGGTALHAPSAPRAVNLLPQNNTSGFRGVMWQSRDRKWRAQIKHLGRRKFLGQFTDPVEAARAYDAAAKKFHGDRAVLNFPSE